MIIAGYEEIPWTKNDCQLKRTLMSLSSPLRIEMDKIEKIYGVFIRSGKIAELLNNLVWCSKRYFSMTPLSINDVP